LIRVNSYQLSLDFESELNLLDYYLQNNKRNAFKNYLCCQGADNFMKKFCYDFDKIREFILQRYERRQAYRLILELKDFHAIGLKVNSKNLIKEMQVKLAA